MSGTDALGLVAGALTTFSAVPQLLRAFRTRSTRDLSPAMLTTMISGTVLWTAYGVLIASVPVALWNAASCAIWSAIGLLRFLHTRTA